MGASGKLLERGEGTEAVHHRTTDSCPLTASASLDWAP